MFDIFVFLSIRVITEIMEGKGNVNEKFVCEGEDKVPGGERMVG